MKNKTKNDEVVTRAVLDEVLEEKLCNYPTKIQVEIMFETWTNKVDERFRKYRDEIMTKMDQIVGVLAQMREDREFDKYDKRKVEEQLDNHEKRIGKLERQGN